MRHRIVRTTALAAAVLFVAGCGVSAGDRADGGVQVEAGTFTGDQGAQALARSADTTTAADTFRMTMTSEFEGMPGGSGMSMTIEGAVDNAAKRSTMTTSMGGAGIDLDMVTDGETVYIRSDVFSSMSEEGTPWVKAELEDLTGVEASSFTENPVDVLGVLEKVGADVETLGTEEIRGETTTHVRAVVGFDDLLANSPNAGVVEKLDVEFDAEDLPDVPIEVWVAEDGTVRRVSMTMDIGAIVGDAGAELDGARIVQTTEFYDFGKPVEIEIPAADEVSDLDLSQLGD